MPLGSHRSSALALPLARSFSILSRRLAMRPWGSESRARPVHEARPKCCRDCGPPPRLLLLTATGCSMGNRCGNTYLPTSEFKLNGSAHQAVKVGMKKRLLPVLLFLSLAVHSPAQTCREVVRESSGRIVQTVERQQQAGGTVRSVTRDASGRITSTATTRSSGGTTTRTDYRDASGRLMGSATTRGHAHSNSSRTTYRDASGRVAGSADTGQAAGTATRTQFRDASGRLTGSQTTSGSPSGSFVGTQRDASGRLMGSSTGSGKCQAFTRVPDPPPAAKK